MSTRQPVTIPVQPWFKDHSFGGKTVFAAVETMILLAEKTLEKHAGIGIRVMEDALFAKFLEVPESAESLNVFVECEEHGGRIRSKLLSQIQIGAMRRIKEHGEIFFAKSQEPPLSVAQVDRLEPPHSAHEVTSEEVYHRLVPFGPCYHTLQDKLLLSEQGAWGKLRAPKLPFTNPVQEVIGSPFPLDGAMHAACVLGQQRVDYPPFPVGFKRRTIVQPTQPGAEYLVTVKPVSHTADEEIFDLCIFNAAGEIFETVTELRMRDVRKALR